MLVGECGGKLTPSPPCGAASRGLVGASEGGCSAIFRRGGGGGAIENCNNISRVNNFDVSASNWGRGEGEGEGPVHLRSIEGREEGCQHFRRGRRGSSTQRGVGSGGQEGRWTEGKGAPRAGLAHYRLIILAVMQRPAWGRGRGRGERRAWERGSGRGESVGVRLPGPGKN